MTDLPRPRPWYRLQFNLGTLLWLMLVVGLLTAWWNDRRRFDERLQKLEQTYYPTAQPVWGAADILGAPDDPTGMAGKSWCPLNSQGADWIEVGFPRPVAASTIDLHETYSLGCVTEVFVVDASGNETSIWKGTDPTPTIARTGIFQVPVPASIKTIQRVKIHVDSVGKSSWPCLDAVGLTTAAGKTTWATSSHCSSVYGNGPLTATKQTGMWQGLW
ncbi:hypothetical protein NA78x_003241 [Anatilimnocola sp. NA78]|uniref:hypothetical protein n=1 Tax=Anatilimnocola sp. NA78 TaxID=3415683 RepID=UPI003CE5730B